MTASAATTAESAPAFGQFAWYRKERVPAVLAAPSHCPQPAVALLDEDLVFADLSSPGAVAGAAGRHEVLGGVVQRVAIDVIRNQGMWEVATLSDDPRDLPPAPAACVRPGAEAVVQDHACLADESSGAGQRMVGESSHPAVRCARFTARVIGAARRAVPTEQARRALVRLPALAALPLHLTSVRDVTDGVMTYR